jgi:hypothetical protein
MQRAHGVKVSVLTRGGLTGMPQNVATRAAMCGLNLSEVSRGHITACGKDRTIERVFFN